MKRLKGGVILKDLRSDDLKRLLEHIHTVQGIDLRGYRRATVVRKLELRLLETKARDYAAYLTFIQSNPDEVQALVRSLSIKVSSLFRDPLVFDVLRSRVIPALVGEFGFLNAWSIGSARGEEPYSLAMVIHELRQHNGFSASLHIQGTDIDPDAITKAQTGEYPDEAFSETEQRYIDNYFTASPYQPHSGYGHKHYILRDEIKAMVNFSCDNIITMLLYKKSYIQNYNLILCRNVLIYLNREMQEWIITTLGDILLEKGYFLLGESETMPEKLRDMFEQPFPSVKIFRKKISSAAG